MYKYLLLTSLLVILINTAQNAEILVINPTPSYSHFIIPFKLAKELANRGHKVTCINSYPQREKIENYKDIPVVENIPLLEEVKKTLFQRSSLNIFQDLTNLFDFTGAISNATIHNKNVQKLLNSNKNFDVVIIEHFFNEAHVGFAKHFNAPTILISTTAANAMNNYIFANPGPVSYIPGGGGDLTKHMNFWQRLKNLFMTSIFNVLLHLYHLPNQKKQFNSFVKDAEFEDILYNTSLMLTNSHVSMSDAIPLLPNIIEVGGIHVETKPLPKDLQEFLDEATEGVILFSMGSNLRSDELKPETKQEILKAFGKLKQKILWKFETDLPEAPDNVKIAAWLPQQDILNHPNVKAFISHGGRLSTIEAVYFGVPIIGIPVFADQMSNIAAAVAAGYAIQIDLKQLSEEKLSWALNEIITNPKYKRNVEQRSKLMHDQPLKPLDSAVFWVEHVIRHKGAPHFRSAGLDLKWYQREMIDIILFITIVPTILFIISCLSLKKFIQLCFRKKAKVSKSKKNK